MTAPLVTLLLTTYKQEPFVREAVRSVLRQDYQPLQIVISDDASPDRTFDIAAEEMLQYRGPHQVRIRRNDARMRSVRHLEEVMPLVQGEFVVMAHGDDIAMPGRVSALVEAWQSQRVSMVSSNAFVIDGDGNRHVPVGAEGTARRIAAREIASGMWAWEMLGATLAMEPTVIRGFQPLAGRLAVGLDHVLPMRAAVLKGLYYVDQPLVLYRRHGGNLSKSAVNRRVGSRTAFVEADLAFQLMVHTQWLEDISSLSAARPEDAMLNDIRLLLVGRLYHELSDWCRCRAALHGDGKVPAWQDETAVLEQPIRFPHRLDRVMDAAPGATEPEIPEPGAALARTSGHS